MSKPVAGTLPVKAYRANWFTSATRYLTPADVEVSDAVTQTALLAHLREQGWEGEWIARLLEDNLALRARVDALETIAEKTDAADSGLSGLYSGVSG